MKHKCLKYFLQLDCTYDRCNDKCFDGVLYDSLTMGVNQGLRSIFQQCLMDHMTVPLTVEYLGLGWENCLKILPNVIKLLSYCVFSMFLHLYHCPCKFHKNWKNSQKKVKSVLSGHPILLPYIHQTEIFTKF